MIKYSHKKFKCAQCTKEVHLTIFGDSEEQKIFCDSCDNKNLYIFKKEVCKITDELEVTSDFDKYATLIFLGCIKLSQFCESTKQISEYLKHEAERISKIDIESLKNEWIK